jgi:chromosome partitioning protein
MLTSVGDAKAMADRDSTTSRKPIFLLRSADGAIGAHQRAVHDAYGHFEALARRLLDVVGLTVSA